MKISQHIIISGLISGLVYLCLHSAGAAIASFISGVFIDFDHMLDYVLNYGFPFHIRHFFSVFHQEVLRRVILVLHSWEWIIILFIILIMVDWNSIATGLFIGYFIHLLLDNCVNHCRPMAYFFSYRLFHHFIGKYYYTCKEYRRRLKLMKLQGIVS